MPLYKATCSITWNFENTGKVEEAIAQAQKFLQELAPLGVDYRLFKVKKDKSTRKNIVLGSFAIDEVLPFITEEETRREYKIGERSYSVRMNSQRYFVFRESLKCKVCGLEGTHFLLEHNHLDKSPHFNLYAKEDGRLVLMTKDHTVAKSLGGKNSKENYHTYCSICNNLKGNYLFSPNEVYELRKAYDKNIRILSRKDLNKLLESEKERLLSTTNFVTIPT